MQLIEFLKQYIEPDVPGMTACEHRRPVRLLCMWPYDADMGDIASNACRTSCEVLSSDEVTLNSLNFPAQAPHRAVEKPVQLSSLNIAPGAATLPSKAFGCREKSRTAEEEYVSETAAAEAATSDG